MTRIIPAHPLSGGQDRAWRVVLVSLATLMVVLAVGSLATLSVVAAAQRASFTGVPAVQTFGRPEAVTVRSDADDITVRTSTEVTELTVRLRDTGGAATVRARIAEETDRDGRTVLRIEQPGITMGLGGETITGIEVLVPRDLAATMDLEAATGAGDVTAEGAFGTLSLSAGVGDLRATNAAVTGELRARTDVGDVVLRLAEGAEPRPITATSSTGDITIEVPGSAQYLVHASTDVGEVLTGPGIETLHGSVLEARTDVGDVRISR